MAEDLGNLVVKVGLDGSAFSQGVTEINKKMALLKSEFSATSSKLKEFGSNTDQLKNKFDFLNRAAELQKAKVQALAQAYERSKTETGENSKATQELGIKLNQAVSYYNKLQGELNQTSSELDKQSNKWLNVSKAMETASTKLKSVGDKISGIGKTLAMSVSAPIIAAGTAAVKLASDVNESMNKVDVAFGGSSNKVKDWSNTTLKSFAIAKGTALDMAALFGDMATSMGMSTDQAADMSMSLVGLAGDLASFKNIRIDVAETALKSIFTGETESLKELGIVMTQANLQEYAYSKGIKKKIQDMSQSEQVQLRYNYVLEKSKNSMGDFARTQGSTANQTRIFQESLKELGASFGQYILPVITPLIQKLNEWVQKFGELSEGTKKFILVVAGIVAVIPPILIVIGNLISAFGTIAGVVSSASAAIAGAGGAIAVITSPIGIVIAAIAGLIAIFVLAYKNSEEFRNKVNTVFSQVKETISGIIENLKVIFSVFVQVAKEIWAKYGDDIMKIIEMAFTYISTVVITVLNVISNIIKVITGVMTGDWNKAGEGLKGITDSIWNGIKAIITAALNVIKAVISLGVQVMFEIIKSVFSAISSYVSSVWNNVKSSISSVWEGIKSTVSSAVHYVYSTVSGGFSSIVGAIASIGGSIRSAVSSVFEGVRSAISSKIESAKSIVSNGLNSIKSFFSGLSLSLPSIKLPHFSISGSLSLNPPSVPSIGVNWYAKGGIFNSASVIGVGEAGQEAVLPIDRLDDLMAKAIKKAGERNININVDTMVVQDKGSNDITLQQLQFLSAL